MPTTTVMRFAACFLSFSIVLLLCASCQRGPEETLGDPPPPPVINTVNDSIYLKQIITLDTSYAAGLDTFDKFVMYYDGLKRLDSLAYIGYDEGTANISERSYEKRFYRGSDSLPYKTADFDYSDPSTPIYLTHFYSYRNAIVETDSLIVERNGITEIRLKKYKVVGNGKIAQIVYLNNGGWHLSDSIISIQTWQNGNLVTQVDTAFMTTVFFKNEKTTREFDNHPNPLRRFNIPYPVVTLAGFTDIGYLQHAISINNETHNEQIVEGGLFDNYIDKYQYRADGYPIISRNTWNDLSYKVIYTYEKLP